MTKFELWDADTASLIGTYPDEPSALAVVREGVESSGRASWQGVGLLRIGDREDDDALIAESDELIALAQRGAGSSSSARVMQPSRA